MTLITTFNEQALHRQLKEWLYQPGDEIEAPVNGYFADLRRENLLIEVQTKNFGAIRNKLNDLLTEFTIQLVFPIPQRKWICTYDTSGNLLRRRKSPKQGQLLHLFDELIRFPQLILNQGFSLRTLLIEMEEHRCDDGRGSWRRKGQSIINRQLLTVQEDHLFHQNQDFLTLLPRQLREPFSNKDLADAYGISARQSQRIAYCLHKMNVLQRIGKKGNAYLYQKNPFLSE